MAEPERRRRRLRHSAAGTPSAAADGSRAASDGSPGASDGSPEAVDGPPEAVDGPPVAVEGSSSAAAAPSVAGAHRSAEDQRPLAAAGPVRDAPPPAVAGGASAYAAQTRGVYDPGAPDATVTEAPGAVASPAVTSGAEPTLPPARPRRTTGSRRRPGGRGPTTPPGADATEAGEAGPAATDTGGTGATGNGPPGNGPPGNGPPGNGPPGNGRPGSGRQGNGRQGTGAGDPVDRGAAHRAPTSPAPGRHSGPAVGGTGSTPPGDDRDAERGLRGLVGPGSSQVNVAAAMRARDAARPTDADLAAAEERLTIVRRNWVPRDDLPRNR